MDEMLIDPALLELETLTFQFANKPQEFLPTLNSTSQTDWDLDVAEVFDDYAEAYALSSDDEAAERPKRKLKSSARKGGFETSEDEFVAFTDSQVFSHEANARRQASNRAGLETIEKSRARSNADMKAGFMVTVPDSNTQPTANPKNRRTKRKIEELESKFEYPKIEEESQPQGRRRIAKARAPNKSMKVSKRKASMSTNRAVHEETDSEEEYETSDTDDYMPRAKRATLSQTQTRTTTKANKKSTDKEEATTTLQQPLSQIAESGNPIPEFDIEKFVNRSTKQRLDELNNSKRPDKIPRPMNAFMLYRKAYQSHCAEHSQQRNHIAISRVCGESWHMETADIKQKFTRCAMIEKENHAKAYVGYRYLFKKNPR